MTKYKITKIFIVVLLLFYFVKVKVVADYSDGFGKNLEDIKIGKTEEGWKKASAVLQYMPIGKPIEMLGNSTRFVTIWARANKDSDTGEVDVLGAIVNFLNIMSGNGTSKEDDFPTRLALQQTFYSNAYCSDQQLYIEESDLISKQVANSVGNNFGVFPVYPIHSKVTGNFCDTNWMINENFKTNFSVQNVDTRCSYNFTIEDPTCMLEINLPILIEYTTLAVAKVITITAMGCGKEKKENPQEQTEQADKLKEVADAAAEAGEETGKEAGQSAAEEAGKKASSSVGTKISTGLSIIGTFGDILLAPLTTDPINLYGKYVLENSAQFLISDSVQIVKNALQQNYACIPAIIGFRFAPFEIMLDSITIWNRAKYDETKKVFKKHRFCGHNWETWSNDYNYDDSENNKNIPELGMNNNSRYKAVYDCMNNGLCDTTESFSPNNKILDDSYCAEYSKSTSSDNEDEKYDIYDSNFCNNVNKNSKHVKNRIYREYMYLGKETVVFNKNGNLDIEKYTPDGDNRTDRIDYKYYDCIDPRLPEVKGYVQPNQRYYMRGNQKANFQCNRFFYDGNGCVVNGNYFTDKDKTRLREVFKRIIYEDEETMTGYEVNSSKDDSKDYGDREYFIIDPSLSEEAKQLANEFSSQCSLAFERARHCCRRRSENFVCIETHDNENQLGEDKTAESYFCMGNVVANNNSLRVKSIWDGIYKKFSEKGQFIKFGEFDETKVVCETNSGSFEVSKKIDTQYMCVFSKGLCPYNFRLNAGLNYKASFCDSSTLNGLYSNYDIGVSRMNRHMSKKQCEGGFFYNENLDSDNEPQYENSDKGKYMNKYISTMAKEYDDYAKDRGYNNSTYNIFYFHKIKEDMEGFNRNDFDIIYKDDINKDGIDVNNMTYSDFIKYSRNDNVYKIKNFCQYKAHCVEVEREFINDDSSTGLSLFIDNSCLGKSNNSRAVSSFSILGGTLPIKQFSAPVVECIYESFSNIISGKAGSSLCNNGYSLNNDGYCGGDTEESVKKLIDNGRTLELKTKYKQIDETLIIKGYLMPEKYVPFIKLQKYLLNTMKALLALFLALYGLSKIITGDMKSILEFITSPKLSQQILNFAIVMWLAFGNGMYSTVYQKIKEFSIGTFLFMDELLVGSLMDKTATVLKQDENVKALKIKQMFSRRSANSIDFPLCYHRNFNGDILYKEGRENTLISDKNNNVSCPLGYKQVKNKTMYIYTGKKPKTMDNLRNELVISTNQAINTLLYFIDTYNSQNGDSKVFLMIDDSKISTNNNEGEITVNTNDNYTNNISGLWNPNYDGCYFSIYEYRENKEYLALFDAMDCKMGKYFGFMLERGLPNIFAFAAMMMIPDMLSGIPVVGTLSNLLGKLVNFAGTTLFTLIITYFLTFMSLIIKMVFIFTTSFLNLGVLLMFTPMMLPLMLYDKTKSMFDNWFKQIRSAIMTPCMNIFPIILVFHILDLFLFSDITFENFKGFGRQPDVVCPANSTNIICFISNGVPVFSQIDKLVKDFSTTWKIVLNMLLCYAIIKMGDKVIGELGSIISGLMPWGDKSSSLSSYTGEDTIDLANTDKMLETANDLGTKAVEGSKALLNQSKDLVERKTAEGINYLSNFKENLMKEDTTDKFRELNKSLTSNIGIHLDQDFYDEYDKNEKEKEPFNVGDEWAHNLFNWGSAIKDKLDEKEARDPNSRWVKLSRGFERLDVLLKKAISFLPTEESYDAKANWELIQARGEVSDYVDDVKKYTDLTEKEREEVDKKIKNLQDEMLSRKEKDIKDIIKKIRRLKPTLEYQKEVYENLENKREALQKSLDDAKEAKEKKKKEDENNMKTAADIKKKKEQRKVSSGLQNKK